jgi:pSer/pThr/pTyr-binding forkhead associated (FHA) protein/pimeloyl-ACP methyl ester carboxylesterase
MEPMGYFTIRISDLEQEHAPKVEGPSSHGEMDEASVRGSGYSVRLGWTQGVPYLTDLGGASPVLLNDTPVEPNKATVLRAGDRIQIGNVRLTWNAGIKASRPVEGAAGAQAPKVTQVLPRETIELPGPRTTAPVEMGEELTPTEAADATLIVSKGLAQRIRAASQEPAPVEPERAPEPTALATPQELGQPLLEPEERSATQAPTLIAPKKGAKQAADDLAPGAPSPTVEEPGAYKTMWVDMEQLLDEDLDLDLAPTTILRDNQIPHLVFHTPDRTWEAQFTKESMTIGRGEGNDISIPDESVSQLHARIERRGDSFVIRDEGSRNGVWLGEQRVEEHWLQDGDVLRLGRAEMVFKGGFTPDELTLMGTPRIDGKPARRPVVFVPGLMGTELWIGSERLWPEPKTILSGPEVFRLPGDPRIEPRGIVNEVVIVPNLIEQRQYSALGDYLVGNLGYTRGKDLLEFGYDWRQDVRLSAQRLAEAIEGWQAQAPITIVAHSLGTLVTRYYVERLGGKRTVERILLMGGPYHGTPKGLACILSGPSLLPFGMGAERMRQILATFPSAYITLPTYRCVTDQHGNHIDVLRDESWLPEHQRPFLRLIRSYWHEVGTTSSVPAVSIFGYGLKTKLRAKVDRGPDGQWEKVEFIEDTAGDKSVPSGSAVLKGSEIHPVLQEHGSLYVDDDVRMRLKVELTRSTTWQGRR